MRSAVLCVLLVLSVLSAVSGQVHQSIYLDPGTTTELQRVGFNDNRSPAGTTMDGVLDVKLEVVWADWRIETPDGPGLRVAAIAELGGLPMIPGPLIRTETGTRINAHIRNTLTDSSITIFGLQSRPATTRDSLVVAPGEVGSVTFDSGEPGTYFYWIRLGSGFDQNDDEREQLAGAIVIDPKGGSPPDRVFVMNVYSTRADTTKHDAQWYEALTVNGLSWPFTERQRPTVGDTVRWRVINASNRNHPMHLHGFFYTVMSRGSLLEDSVYEPADRRTVVTEFMFARSTMTMEWVPRRPGNWLFHCHLSFHVSSDIRLPMAQETTDDGHAIHMAGLVLGIEVAPGQTDLISHGEPRHITLYANEYGNDSTSIPYDIDSLSSDGNDVQSADDDGSHHRYGFSLDPNFHPDSLHRRTPGPHLILKQYQTTFVTVENRMSTPTGIHWHGLELDSWSDGVPGWSASDGKVSPVIPPGGSFTYKLALMRPGTFIYHSHLNDIEQLSGGLYGAILVFGEDDEFQSESDHVYNVGWRSPDPRSLNDMELNGLSEQPPQRAAVGETHRIRLINIAPAGRITVRMVKDEISVPLRTLAKDGADLPESQQVDVEVSPVLGVGETADFLFTPAESGTYELVVAYPWAGWTQRWEVAE